MFCFLFFLFFLFTCISFAEPLATVSLPKGARGVPQGAPQHILFGGSNIPAILLHEFGSSEIPANIIAT